MIPLAEQLRPNSLEEVAGQKHLVGENGFLTQLIKSQKPLSLLFWGPPGCGKTTLARLYAQAFPAKFITLSAVLSGVADIKKVIHEVENAPLFHKTTILFVDEIHRFNKAQQDAFLPYVEKGSFILLGATTENPSFALNPALLSRMRVLEVKGLEPCELEQLLSTYERKRRHLPLTSEAKQKLIENAQGDGRYLFNLIENLEQIPVDETLDTKELFSLLQRRAALFDKKGDGHYNLISALHKSVRGSDPQAALYWFARMLEGGEDPLFIARRLIRMATEDIGLADPDALKLTIAARDAYQMLGSPEGELALAEAVIYLSLAPKSNALYKAYQAARKKAAATTHSPPPKVILNAPTHMMTHLGYGEGYQYDHDQIDAFSGQGYFPDGLTREQFYQPVERGFEREMKKRLSYFDDLRLQKEKKFKDE